MRTVAETPIFQKYANDVWSDAERIEYSSTGLPITQRLAMSFQEAVVVGKFGGHPLAKASEVVPG